MRYEIQELTLCDGWVNTWHEWDDDNEEIPMTFDTYAHAVEQLEEHLYDYQKAFTMGDVDSPEDRENFRIVEVL